MPRPILVSACLLGLKTRYDGRAKPCAEVVSLLQQAGFIAIPVCPEQLGGLPTPRPAAEFSTGDGRTLLQGCGQVVNRLGIDVSAALIRGADATLEIARMTGCTQAILKERSPSCGVNRIYRRGELSAGCGVTTARLTDHQLRVVSECELLEGMPL